MQVVAVGTLPELAASKTPLADAARLFLGGAGAALITLGAVLSTTGNNMGRALSGSRNLFALAEQGDLPAFFGRIHPGVPDARERHTGHAAVSLVLAVSGRFRPGLASAISRLIVYRRDVRGDAAAQRRRSPAASTRRRSSCRSGPSSRWRRLSSLWRFSPARRREQLIAGRHALSSAPCYT